VGRQQRISCMYAIRQNTRTPAAHLATTTFRPPSDGRSSTQVRVPSGSREGEPRPRVLETISSLLMGETQQPVVHIGGERGGAAHVM
jgi:hypothetical protein